MYLGNTINNRVRQLIRYLTDVHGFRENTGLSRLSVFSINAEYDFVKTDGMGRYQVRIQNNGRVRYDYDMVDPDRSPFHFVLHSLDLFKLIGGEFGIFNKNYVDMSLDEAISHFSDKYLIE